MGTAKARVSGKGVEGGETQATAPRSQCNGGSGKQQQTLSSVKVSAYASVVKLNRVSS